jgi:integrase
MKDKTVTRQALSSERHYVLPVSIHDTSPTPGSHRTRAPKRPMTLPSLTFADLKIEMSKRSQSGDSVSPASLANALSALSQFMSERGLIDDHCVSTQMRAGYAQEINAHAKALEEQGRAGEYIRNRKALMKRWRRLVLDLDRAAAAQGGTETPFQHALRALFDRVGPVRPIADHLCVPYATVKRWLAGSLPRADAVRHIVVLERHFAQPPGTLLDLLPHGCVPPSLRVEAGSSPSVPNIPFRARLSKNSREPYALRKVSPELQSEWGHLVHHKTSFGAGRLQRQVKGAWSTTDLPVKRAKEVHWYAKVGVLGGASLFCQTAEINWGYVAQFLGWRVLPSEAGGAGLSQDGRQSLVCLTDVDDLERYLHWRVARSGGALHEGIGGVLKFVASLCHPTTGFLTQSRERFSWHPDAATDAAWTTRCQMALRFARNVLQQAQDRGKKSRDPEAPVAHLMALPNPLHAVSDAIARMDAARRSTGGVCEAKWARDRLMLKLLASNPLRAKNLKLLTIAPDAKGAPAQLRKVNGGWRIAIPREAFKNFAGAAKDREYDMPVRKELWKDLDAYIDQYRPLLAAASNPYLLTADRNSEEPYHHLNRHFAAVTRRYFTRCPGTGPHIMRHIVATTILKLQPNAWAAAAYVLHDKEETVKKNYAHLKSDDAARWIDSLMAEALKGS